MRAGKISREEGTRAIEETKRSLEEATRDGQETPSTSPRKDDARTGMKTIGVEPRFVPEEEYNRVEADLKRQVAAGNIREEEASRELVKLQNANNMATLKSLFAKAKQLAPKPMRFTKSSGSSSRSR